MKLKTLKVNGELAFRSDYYPKGTERTVIAYFLFPRTLEGVRRRGIQIVEQVAGTYVSSDGYDASTFNDWKNIRFLVPKELEMKTMDA